MCKTATLRFWASLWGRAWRQCTLFIVGSLESFLVDLLLVFSDNWTFFSLVLRLIRRYGRISIRSPRVSKRGGSIWPKISGGRGHPHQPLCRVGHASKCLTTLLLKVFTQRNFVADVHPKKSTFARKTATAFLSPPLWGLGETYAVHLRLIGKPIADFLFLITELFSLGDYGGWSATSEYRWQVRF